jgi:vacuolar-type H+-ATPase subunit H
MTTNHVADQSTHDTGAPVDASQPEQSQQAEDASRQLLAKARYDAFRLMTEARDEAEMILDEAKAEAAGTKKAAELTAASAAGRADEESNKIIESAREEAAAIVARAHRTAGEQESSEDGDQLEAEHKALSERVSTLRSLASQLEDRFAALAATAGTPAPDRASTPTHPADASQDRAAPIIDYSPVVDPKPKDDAKTPATESDNRESFYNRRSANLPRLGEEGGRSAFNMTRLMREAMETD